MCFGSVEFILKLHFLTNEKAPYTKESHLSRNPRILLGGLAIWSGLNSRKTNFSKNRLRRPVIRSSLGGIFWKVVAMVNFLDFIDLNYMMKKKLVIFSNCWSSSSLVLLYVVSSKCWVSLKGDACVTMDDRADPRTRNRRTATFRMSVLVCSRSKYTPAQQIPVWHQPWDPEVFFAENLSFQWSDNDWDIVKTNVTYQLQSSTDFSSWAEAGESIPIVLPAQATLNFFQRLAQWYLPTPFEVTARLPRIGEPFWWVTQELF